MVKLPTLINYKNINPPQKDVLLSASVIIFNLDPDCKYLLKAKELLSEQFRLYIDNIVNSAGNIPAEDLLNTAKSELKQLDKITSYANLKTVESATLLYAIIGNWKILTQDAIDEVGKQKLENAFRSYGILLPSSNQN